MKALVGALNQEKALVGAFSVIVPMEPIGTDGSICGTSHQSRPSTASNTILAWRCTWQERTIYPREEKEGFFFKPRTTKAFPSYKIEFQCILVSCMHPFYFVYFQNTKLLFPAASHPPAGAYLAETGKSSGAGGGCGPRRVLNLHINIGTCGAEPGTRHPAHLAQAHTDLDMRVNTIIINIFHGLWNF